MHKTTVGLCALLFLSGLLAACSHTPAEQQVRNAINAGEAAIEQADAGALGKLLSKEFDGDNGALDRRAAMRMLRAAHLRHARVRLLVGPVDVQPRGERMLANFSVTLRGGAGWLPDQIGIYKVRTAWKKEGRTWRCYNATWQRKL